jgi:hypothetical protein
MSMRTKSKGLELPRDPLMRENGAATPRDLRDLDALVHRFDPFRRRAVRRLILSSPRVADLAAVFPGALYALAVRRGAAVRRRKALDLVERGAPLKEVAQALDLPFWLRRLPPEAYSGSVPALPATEVFGRRVVNHLPATPSESAFWLRSIAFGAKACDEYFALWLAAQPVYPEPGDPEHLFGLLAAYAWYSSAEPTRCQGLIVVPWRPEMAFDTAVCAAKSWLNRIRLVLQLREGAVTDPWLEPGEAHGLTFAPLLEQAQILAEAHAMQNCADQYADRIARDKCRLFSIRRRGVRVATLEIGPHPREAGVLAISQLKARHNMPAGTEIWQAAHGWLATQKDLKRPPAHMPPSRGLDAAAWECVMGSYRTKKRGAAWIPLIASNETFAVIEADIADLARRGGITSWLFT